MSTAQINGSAVTSTSTVNNGGTMLANGTANTALESINTARENVGVFGSTVVDGDSADKAVSAGTFAYDNEAPISKRITTELAGVASDVLATTGSNPELVRSIHKLETLRTRRLTTAIRNNKWNEYSGEWDAGFPVTATDSLSTDTAANPSRTVPGKLNYFLGSAPVSINYKARTN